MRAVRDASVIEVPRAAVLTHRRGGRPQLVRGVAAWHLCRGRPARRTGEASGLGRRRGLGGDFPDLGLRRC